MIAGTRHHMRVSLDIEGKARDLRLSVIAVVRERPCE